MTQTLRIPLKHPTRQYYRYTLIVPAFQRNEMFISSDHDVWRAGGTRALYLLLSFRTSLPRAKEVEFVENLGQAMRYLTTKK